MTTKGIISPAPNSANWDVPLNANFAAIEKAFGNSATVTATAGTTILTTDQVGHMCLRCTGALTANLTLQVPSGTAGQWVVVNATTDATGGPWDVSIISAAGGAAIEVTRGSARSVYTDGTANGMTFADTVTAGADGQIVYNDAGELVGSPNLTFDGTNLTVATEIRSDTYKDADGGDTATINGIIPIDEAGVLTTFNATGAAPVYACRAWVNFNGIDGVVIRGSGNVSSVVRNDEGNYTVFFAEPMQDVNYAVCMSYSSEVNSQHGVGFVNPATAVGSVNFAFYSAADSTKKTDKSFVAIAIFR